VSKIVWDISLTFDGKTEPENEGKIFVIFV
jgi:hypothetical protein